MLHATIQQESRPKVQRLGRYGPTDLDRFENICVGHGSFGKVKIDCSFLFHKSKWGIVGGIPGSPGGIVYLDLNFNQPPDCRMTHATVSVTVDDRGDAEDYENRNENSFTRRRDQSHLERLSPVRITTFGPRCLTGEQKVKMVEKTIKLTPNLEVAGNGFGGLGMDKTQSSFHTSRWLLRGDLQPDKYLRYKTVQWVLSANELDGQVLHSSVFKTAFAFAHDRRPVVLKVEISGKLERLKDRLKEKLRFSGRGDDGSTKTAAALIIFGRDMTWASNLRPLEEGLERDLEYENYHTIPVEIPDPQRADFGPAPISPSLPTISPSVQSQQSAPAAAPSIQPAGSMPGLLRPSGDATVNEIFDDAESTAFNDPTEPTLANLANFANPASNMHNVQHHRPQSGAQSWQRRDTAQDMRSQATTAGVATTTDMAQQQAFHSDAQSDDATVVGDSVVAGVGEKEAMTLHQMLERFLIVRAVLGLIVWMMGIELDLEPATEKHRKKLPGTPPIKSVKAQSPESGRGSRLTERRKNQTAGYL